MRINFNPAIADIPDLGPDETVSYYRAYRAFMALTRDERMRCGSKHGRATSLLSTIGGRCMAARRGSVNGTAPSSGLLHR